MRSVGGCGKCPLDPSKVHQQQEEERMAQEGQRVLSDLLGFSSSSPFMKLLVMKFVSLLEPIYVFISQFEIMNIYMEITRDGQGCQSRGSWPWGYSLLERGLFGNRSV